MSASLVHYIFNCGLCHGSGTKTVWFLVGNGGMDSGDMGDYIGTTIRIHSRIPY